MRKLILGLMILGFVQIASAQSALKGKVVDTADKKNLENAVVSLLRKQIPRFLNLSVPTKMANSGLLA